MSGRLEQLQQFYQQDPNDPFITYGIAMEHHKLGDIAQMFQWLDKTIALDPDHAYAYYQKARALIDEGHKAEAIAAIEQGLAAAGRSSDSHAASELNALRDSMRDPM